MSDETTKTSWGSWEELLLACAVKRHGFKNWNSVAMEIQTKTSLPQLQTTVQCCKQKYQELKRRFKVAADKDNNNNYYHKVDDDNNNILCLEEQLRKVRVDELKQEVQRYDLSILSLQLKVKRLEEEGSKTINIIQRKPDLDDQKTASLNDKIIQPESKKSEEKLLRVSKRGEEESDRENRSVNESNSTGLSDRIVGEEGEEELIKDEPEPVQSDGGKCEGPVESESNESESNAELGDSVTQFSSDDVQSSASFGRRKRKRDSGDSIKDKETDVKSEPLIRLLEMIRTHNTQHASMFQRRLKSQESNNYKELIRQHVDLETIQTRVGGSYYSSCILNFYRDLLLLFNNAIVYFPKASLEAEAAHQLRNLVSNEIRKETQKSYSSQDDHHQVPPLPPQPPPSQPKPLLERSDSLLAKHKSLTPIIMCRKRNSVSAKQSSSLAQKVEQQEQLQSDHTKKPATDVKPTVERSFLKVKKEEKKPVITGARSSRSNSRNLTSNTPPSGSNSKTSGSNSKKQNAVHGSKGDSGSLETLETTPKTEKKKIQTSVKKKSVVDFLKRIKKNSPVQTGKKSSEGGNKPNGSEEQKRNNSNSANGKKEISSNKGKERVVLRSNEKKPAKEETSPSKRSVGRPSKKTVDASKVTVKRGRESGVKEMVAAKRQRKRVRR